MKLLILIWIATNSPLAFAYSNVYDRPLQPLCLTPTLSATYQKQNKIGAPYLMKLNHVVMTSLHLFIHLQYLLCLTSVPLRVGQLTVSEKIEIN